MRILFLVSSMQGGGAERVAAFLCNAWAEAGHQVTLMPTFSGKGNVVYDLEPRVHLDFLSDHVAGHRGRLRRILALRAIYRSLKPDVVVSFLTDVNIAALLAGFGTRVPVVVSERSYPPLLQPKPRALIRLLRRWLYPRAAAVIAQNRETARWLEAACPGSTVKVLPNPITLTPAPLRPTKDRRMILSVGRVVASKRNRLLIDVFARIAPQFPDWDLVIVGDGPDCAPLMAHVATLGLGGRVLFPGRASDVSQWYARAGLYVLASEYEGMPNTLIEAMAHGLASVVFDILTGPRDVTDDGTLAVLLPDDHHDARLETALRDLLSDENLREELGHKALAIRDVLSAKRILADWCAVLEDAQAPRPRPGGIRQGDIS